MKNEPRLLQRKADKVIYSLPSIGLLNDGFISKLDWPEEIPYLVFRVSRKLAPKRHPIRNMVTRRKYVCRTSYIVHKSNIPLEKATGRGHGLELGSFRNFPEYKREYVRTHDADFTRVFGDYDTPAYRAEIKQYIQESLPKTKGVCVRSGGKVIAMLSLLRIGRHSWFSPLHWITWLWADQAQPREVRRAAHAMLRAWVRRNISGYVGASVNAPNLKSQNWFIKLGARPCQIFFSRR